MAILFPYWLLFHNFRPQRPRYNSLNIQQYTVPNSRHIFVVFITISNDKLRNTPRLLYYLLRCWNNVQSEERDSFLNTVCIRFVAPIRHQSHVKDELSFMFLINVNDYTRHWCYLSPENRPPGFWMCLRTSRR